MPRGQERRVAAEQHAAAALLLPLLLLLLVVVAALEGVGEGVGAEGGPGGGRGASAHVTSTPGCAASTATRPAATTVKEWGTQLSPSTCTRSRAVDGSTLPPPPPPPPAPL